jgi:hypothetical protein
MKLTLKLYATLAEYLPASARDNQIDLEFPQPPSPHSVLDILRVPHARAHLLLVNGSYVPPTERDSVLLNEGDVVAAWPPVAGG